MEKFESSKIGEVMSCRYFHIDEWQNLQDGRHEAIVDVSIGYAEEANVDLAVCVNTIKHSEQILQKCFSQPESKTLLSGKEITKKSVKIKIESISTLKKEPFTKPKIYLALFPSPDLINQIERIESKKMIVVFSEVQNSEHLMDWVAKHDARELESK